MKKSFFSAIYRDGKVQIAGQWFDAGSFAVSLLNQFYENDKAARLSVFRSESDLLMSRLQEGFLVEGELEKVGKEYLYVLETLETLHPFELTDVESERNRIRELFTEETEETILCSFKAMGLNASSDVGARDTGVVPVPWERLFRENWNLLREIGQAERMYHSLGREMADCFDKLREFIRREDEAEKLNEDGLLPIALEIFRCRDMPVFLQYELAEDPEKETNVIGREMFFDSYKSFITADFFEGLHYGHYPRRCLNCGRYFLMKSARKQLYGDGISPFTVRGRQVSCRQAAKADRQKNKEKETAAANPILDLCRRRQACIRAEKSRGTITEEFAEQARRLAENRCDKAVQNPAYAAGSYEEDLQRDKLYEDVRRGCTE